MFALCLCALLKRRVSAGILLHYIMESSLDEDWEVDFDDMASQEEELIEQARIEAAMHEEAWLLGIDPPGIRSVEQKGSQGSMSSVIAGKSSVTVSPTMPYFPAWELGGVSQNPASNSGGSSSSSGRAVGVMSQSVLQVQQPALLDSAPTTPPPSKRQRDIADDMGSPPKIRAGKFGDVSVQPVEIGDKADWSVMSSPTSLVGGAAPVVLPLSQLTTSVRQTGGVGMASRVCASIEPTAMLVHAATSVAANGSAGTSSQTSSGFTERIRRRLRSKSGGVVEVFPPVNPVVGGDRRRDGKEHDRALNVLELQTAYSAVNWPDRVLWIGFSNRMRFKFANDACRTAWCRAHSEELRRAGAKGRVVALARTAWGALHSDTRKAVCNDWLEKVAKPDYISFADVDDSQTQEGILAKFRGSSMLLTYNNSKWLLPPACTKHGLEKGVEVARRIGWVVKLFESATALLERVCGQYHNLDYAVALEICPASFAQGIGRLHIHAFVKTLCGRVWLPSLKELELDGSLPHCTGTKGGTRSRFGSGFAGFFYVQVSKNGSVFTGGSKQPFTGYPVQTPWVLTLLQGEKISFQLARELVLKCVSGATRALAEIRVTEEARKQVGIARAQEEAQRNLLRERRPWRRIPLVEEWRSQYEELLDRYKFLVLEGPSALGKTVFARTLAPHGLETLELNCAGDTALDLRSFCSEVYGAILFDEISPHQVASQRKMFQACCAKVQLGHSTTGVHVYSVYLHRVRLICCSNDWTRMLQKEPMDVQDWLKANSVLVVVDAPLWQYDTVLR